MKKALLLAAAIMLLTVSCIFDPPEEAQIVPITDLIREMTAYANKMDWSDKEAVLKARDESEEIPRIIFLPEGTRIKFVGKATKPKPEAAFYTNGKNKLKQTETFYLTETSKEGLLFSYDMDTWYSTAYDPENDLMNIYSDFTFETQWEEDQEGRFLNVAFSGSYNINEVDKRTPARFKGQKDRPVLDLKKGMKFYIQTSGLLPKNDMEQITVNLKENIVKFPEGTDILLDFNIDGNLFQMTTCDDCMLIEFFEDIYLYSKPGGQIFSISFDNEKWGAPIGDFKLNPNIQVMALSDNSTQLKFDIWIEHTNSQE